MHPNTNNDGNFTDQSDKLPHVSIPMEDQHNKDHQNGKKPFFTAATRATDDRLVETQRLAVEAEQLGFTTMNDLKRQREQLERARRNLYQTDADLDRSNNLMTSMMRRYPVIDTWTNVII